ncbi:MAG: site-specific DNA-methyltransferase [Treponema bryantii]|nr:site-specific DNA-methyltransferase [Treponema bryantii]
MSENRNSFIEATKPTDERLEALKQLYPELFSDGKLNIDVLKEITGGENPQEDRTPGYYGLYWPGKRKAKIEAKASPKGTLVPVPGDGVNEDTTHNIYIEGDNLEVLRILKQSYKGRVKMIYIDPPYNTGNDFIYPDDYNMPVEEYKRLTGQTDEKGNALTTNQKSNGAFHTKWLNMMLPRLMLARELLTEDGVIFISIDDNEQANLKLLCDDIFGEENFVTCLKWKRKKQPSFLSKHIAEVMEYILVYASDKDVLEKLSIEGTSDATKKVVNLTNKVSERVFNAGCRVKLGKEGVLPKGKYTVKTSVIEYLDDVEYKNGKTIKDIRVKAQFTCSQDKIDSFISEELLFITATKGLRRDVSEEEMGKRKSIVDLLLDWGDNQDSDTEMRDLFGKPVFSYTKPSKLIYNLLKSNYTENSIIVDFFSGSSTTAHGILKLSDEDKQSRKFIMIQLPEDLDKALKTASADEKTIIENAIELLSSINKPHNLCEVAKERIRRAGKTFNNTDLDIGFKVYRMQESNFKEYTPVQGQDENATKSLFEELENNQIPLVDGWKAENVLTEIILKQGFALDCECKKVDAFTKNTVYCIKDSEGPVSRTTTMYVCLDSQVDSDTIEKLKLDEKEKFVCLNNAIDDTSYARLADKGRIETI